MAIKKIKWSELFDWNTSSTLGNIWGELNNFLLKINKSGENIQGDINKIAEEVETLISEKISITGVSYKSITNALLQISSLYFGFILRITSPCYVINDSLWKDLIIYISSYKIKKPTFGNGYIGDNLIFTKISDNLYRYLGWYKKILENDGVAGQVIMNRTYTNNGSSDSTGKDMYSETPQNDLGSITNFENDMIKYASNLSKNTVNNTTAIYGGSNLSTSSKKWEEQLNNLRMVYYNDIIEYIMKIPYMIYSYYSLETVPYPELMKMYCDNIKEVFGED